MQARGRGLDIGDLAPRLLQRRQDLVRLHAGGLGGLEQARAVELAVQAVGQGAAGEGESGEDHGHGRAVVRGTVADQEGRSGSHERAQELGWQQLAGQPARGTLGLGGEAAVDRAAAVVEERHARGQGDEVDGRTAEEGQQQRPGEGNGHRAQHEGAPPSELEREATGEGMVSRAHAP